MNRTRIKICGITRIEDAVAVEAAGGDAIGFVFWDRSKRCVSVDDATIIGRAISPLVTRVGVFVSPTPEEVITVSERVGLDVAQLCGELPSGDWSKVESQVHILRAIGVAPGESPQLDDLGDDTDVLVDSQSESSPGGTGTPFDWSLLANPPAGLRIWLAGGLNLTNVGAAITQVRPYAVDVSTGVEDQPGIKSPLKIIEFVTAVRAADAKHEIS